MTKDRTGLAQQHSFHSNLEAWVAGHVTWAVSTPIVLEYQEVLTRLSGSARWRKSARLMDLAELITGNLLRVTPSFRFQVVAADPDDNIFTDCAITADADYLITEDSDFAPLLSSGSTIAENETPKMIRLRLKAGGFPDDSPHVRWT